MIFTYSILEKAWRNTVTVNSVEHNRAKFKYNLEDNLYMLQEELESGTFYPQPLRLKTIYFPKKRTVQIPAIRDKIVQHAMCDNGLYEMLTKPMIKETGACMVGRGDKYASNVLKENLRKYCRKNGPDFLVLKCDIRHYFASIPHSGLFELIDRYVTDNDIKEIMIRFVHLSKNYRGIALGLQQSQLLANLYLSGLDHMCKEYLRADVYGRHMDDFYIVSNSRNYLMDCWKHIENHTESIGLSLNPKTDIFANKFDFLGFEYRLTDTNKVIMRLAKGKRNAKHRQLKEVLNVLANGGMTIEEFAESYGGWRAHALLGNCHKLVYTWDKWLTEEVKKLGYILVINNRSVKGYDTNNQRLIGRDVDLSR